MAYLRTLVFLGIAAIVLCAKVFIDSRGYASTRKPPALTLQSADHLAKSMRRFSLGFDSTIAGFLWIKLLQDAQHVKMTEGEVSWEYSQLNAVLNLDPGFYRGYDFGATFLSVFRQDKLGAKNILQRWTERFPRYWRAHYTLGYHLYAEMNEHEAAAQEIMKASKLEGAPSWLSALGIRLLSEAGATITALQMAVKLYESASDLEGSYRIGRRIRSLRFGLELAQWKESLAEFRSKHQREPRSLSELTPFRIEKDRQLASIGQSIRIPTALEPVFAERFPFFYNPKSKEIRANLSADDRYLETIGIIRRTD